MVYSLWFFSHFLLLFSFFSHFLFLFLLFFIIFITIFLYCIVLYFIINFYTFITFNIYIHLLATSFFTPHPLRWLLYICVCMCNYTECGYECVYFYIKMPRCPCMYDYPSIMYVWVFYVLRCICMFDYPVRMCVCIHVFFRDFVYICIGYICVV